MLEAFYPDADAKSAYEVDYASLYAEGIRGLIFDIDNTLVGHGKPCTERAAKLLKGLMAQGFSVCLLSNNKKERVESFNAGVGAYTIEDAHKPSRKGYEKAMEMMGTGKGSTASVGDQIFTDVWGAKRTGIKTVLVGQLEKKEEIQIVLKRRLEKIILFFYRRKKKKGSGGEGNR